MSRTLLILSSLFLGLLLSVISVFIAFSTLSDEGSNIFVIILWNFYLAGFLAAKGVLPICKDCELLTLFETVFYGFAVGVIGYSTAFFVFLYSYNKLRSKKATVTA